MISVIPECLEQLFLVVWSSQLFRDPISPSKLGPHFKIIYFIQLHSPSLLIFLTNPCSVEPTSVSKVLSFPLILLFFVEIVLYSCMNMDSLVEALAT